VKKIRQIPKNTFFIIGGSGIPTPADAPKYTLENDAMKAAGMFTLVSASVTEQMIKIVQMTSLVLHNLF
jgi:hypothetical protein